MKRFLRVLHTYYGFAFFLIFFLFLFPFFMVPIAFPKKFKYVGIINRWWAYLLFPIVFLRYTIVQEKKLDPKQQYIFCPNHFSYLDIPIMGLNPINAVFVGKNDMERIPLFGYMYKKLHITVDRSKLKSRMNTILKGMEAIDAGKNLIIFPEGGVYVTQPPHMMPFKDGAFRIAIEKQISIVPVTIPFNWIILPDERPLRLHGGRMKIIFHEPISAKGYSLTQIDELKQKVFQVIDTQLHYENRQGNSC